MKRTRAIKSLSSKEIKMGVTLFLSHNWMVHRDAVLTREAARMKVNK